MDDPTEFLLRLQERMDKSLTLAQRAWHMTHESEKRTQQRLAELHDLLTEATKPPPAPLAPEPSAPTTCRLAWHPCWVWGGVGLSCGLAVGIVGVGLRLWGATQLTAYEVLKLLFGV